MPYHRAKEQSFVSAETKASTPIFFYRPYDSPCGVFCQWHASTFTVPRQSLAYLDPKLADVDPAEIITFNCAEQYMMYCKAIRFHDQQTALRIMSTMVPKEQKAFGKKVVGFNENSWGEVREQVGEEGNWAKFIDPANSHMKRILLDAGDRMLCEASSKDRIWGIGYSEKDARPMYLAGETESWGLNLLGKSVMRVRERIKEQSAISRS